MAEFIAKRLPVRFFETDRGTAPVRDWLLSLSPEDRRIVGTDIQTAEFGWPLGMPALPHGFEKKSQKAPDHELDLAMKRMKGLGQ